MTEKLVLKTAMGTVDTQEITGVQLKQRSVAGRTFYDLEIFADEDRYPLFGYTSVPKNIATIYRDEVLGIIEMYNGSKPCVIPMLRGSGLVKCVV